MKKCIAVLFSFSFIAMGLHAQNKQTESIAIDQTLLMGRWVETERIIDNPMLKDSLQKSSIILFKENNMFHKGEDNNGMIFFGITGKYYISNDSVHINYYDMSPKHAGASNKLRKMTLKIDRLTKSEMLADIQEGRYIKYKALFSRQEATDIGKSKQKAKK